MKGNDIKYVILIALVTLGVHIASAVFVNQGIDADEQRYLDQAERLLNGQDVYPDGRVVNPPLLPIILAGGQGLGLDIENLSIISVIAILVATIFLYLILTSFCSRIYAFIVALFLPLHPGIILHGSQLMSEPYALMAIAIAAFLIQKIAEKTQTSLPLIVTVAVLFTALAMLKPIFGYVLTAALLFSLVAAMFSVPSYKRFLLNMSGSCSIALVLCIPFLVFMYLETGKFFKWSNGGGDHLYYMSIGGEDVWGSWVADNKVSNIPFLVESGYADEIDTASKMEWNARESYVTALALQRIEENPSHLIINIVANAFRVLFNYPYSFRAQSLFSYGFILPNMILYLSLLLSLFFLPYTWRHQTKSYTWFLAFFLIYLGGNILVGSTGRQGLAVVPILLIWLSYQVRILVNIGVLRFPPPVKYSESSPI